MKIISHLLHSSMCHHGFFNTSKKSSSTYGSTGHTTTESSIPTCLTSCRYEHASTIAGNVSFLYGSTDSLTSRLADRILPAPVTSK